MLYLPHKNLIGASEEITASPLSVYNIKDEDSTTGEKLEQASKKAKLMVEEYEDNIIKSNEELAIIAVNNFRDYLRIPSVHPDVDYDDCVVFLQNQAKTLSLPYQIYHCVPKKPIIILTWIGQEPNLPTILLNSHMDVVAAYEEKWTYPPFGAEMDDQKNIYARGTQDMKSVGIQYLEAIRKLKNDGIVLKRTIHISFMPDEELGGKTGMALFVKSNDFKELNVGFALDEGMASPKSSYDLFNGERCVWRMHFHCPGQSGHGSLLLDNTPGEKVEYLLNKFYRLREQEKQKLKDDPTLKIGDVTTVNLTRLMGGVQSNVIPDELSFVVDCRIPLTVNLDEWENTLNRWCEEAGEGVWIEYEQKQPLVPATKLDDSNPYWISFKKAADKLNLQLIPQIFSGGSDSRYIRGVGLPALGFSPMNKTPILMHDHDELLNQEIFLKGIDIYTEILSTVAST